MPAIDRLLHPQHVSLVRPPFTLPSLFHAFADRVDPYYEYDGIPRNGVVSPRFNVTETETKYILDGELPGVCEKNSILVRWLQNQVLLISGETKPGDTESGTDPFEAGTVKNELQAPKQHEDAPAPDRQKIEVEAMTEKPQVIYPRHLLRERALGPFQRSFTFPDEVDADAMKANLKDGLLRVVVPKMSKESSGKRIQVE